MKCTVLQSSFNEDCEHSHTELKEWREKRPSKETKSTLTLRISGWDKKKRDTIFEGKS